MGIGDLFRRKTKAEKYKRNPWSKEEVEKYKERVLEVLPKMHSNFFQIKKIFDRAKEEGWKRNAWEKKNVSEVPSSGGHISVTPHKGLSKEQANKVRDDFYKQIEIDKAFRYRCENKQMMLFTKYLGETEFEFLKDANYKNYKDYFEDQEEFFDTLEWITGKSFAKKMKRKYMMKIYQK